MVLARLLQRVGLLIAPDMAMTAACLMAWLAPQVDPAMAAACAQVMALEGLLIVGLAMVGVYLPVAHFFFPPIVAAMLWYVVRQGPGGLNWVVMSFGWYLVSAFVHAVRAHRGRYGNARVNPDHPARRYDRMLFIYVLSAPVAVAAALIGRPVWAVWGVAYFGALTLCDSVLRAWFDRLPQGVLRRWQASVRSAVVDQMGLCTDCVHVSPAIPQRPSRLVRCQRSLDDARFPEYPATPVKDCDGFENRLSFPH
jgi:hypothetical protein